MIASTLRRSALTLASAAALTGFSLLASAQTLGTPERFTAQAVLGNGRGTTGVEIVVERWSTDAERNSLLTVLLGRGSDKLLEALQKMPKVGFIRSPSSLGWDLHYAWHAALPDGGERVVVATDRPLGFWEEANEFRTLDYPFTIVELHINRDGEGEGKLSLATKIVADKDSGSVVLENYGTQPVLLQGVKRENSTH